MNITTLSLLDIGDCDVGSLEPKEEKVYVQLMQTSDYDRYQDYTQILGSASKTSFRTSDTTSWNKMHSFKRILHGR
ncbi:hypothetical protein PUN28_020490 [Cardiocondyla obscurior]|uniref:Uncharacterized protein n=1 Tax=Cardiocondyla obscurior TaxID=286306 RepID=A0AAW2E8E1_9HYME